MSKTLVIDNPSERLKDRMLKASETKRQIKEHVKNHGTLKGLEIAGVKLVKPF